MPVLHDMAPVFWTWFSVAARESGPNKLVVGEVAAIERWPTLHHEMSMTSSVP